MLCLAIETSTRHPSIALSLADQTIVSRVLDSPDMRPAQALVAEIGDLLHAHGRQPSDVDVIAVSIGPGSFTGLRIGVTCAKTWAFVTSARIVAVDSLQAVAEASPDEITELDVVIDAQRGELFSMHFARGESGFLAARGSTAGMFAPRETWWSQRPTDAVVSGPGVRDVDRESANCRILGAEFCTPMAEHVARIGLRLAEEGQFRDHWTLSPTYLRPSAAEEKWNRDPPPREQKG